MSPCYDILNTNNTYKQTLIAGKSKTHCIALYSHESVKTCYRLLIYSQR